MFCDPNCNKTSNVIAKKKGKKQKKIRKLLKITKPCIKI